MSQLKDSQRERMLPYSALFYSGLWQIRWSPPIPGRTTCFTQFTNSNVNFIQKHLHRHTQNNVWLNVWETHGSVKLTHRSSHHKFISCRCGTQSHLLKSYLISKKDNSIFIISPSKIQLCCTTANILTPCLEKEAKSLSDVELSW